MPRIRLPRKLLVALAAVALLAAAALYIAPMTMDAGKYRDIVVSQVKLLSGQTLQVKGRTQLSLLPSPVLTLQAVELTADTPDPQAPHLTAPAAEIHLGWRSLWADFPQVERVVLQQPALELARDAAHLPQFGFLGGALAAASNVTTPIEIDIDNGRVIVAETRDDPAVRLENIQLSLGMDSRGGKRANGRFSFHQLPFNIALHADAPGEAAAPVTFRLWQNDKTRLEFTGQRTLLQDRTTLDGAFTLAIENAALFADPASKAAPYPVSAGGKVQWAGDTVKFSELTLESPDSAGGGSLDVKWGEAPQWIANFQFSRLKLQPQWFAPLFATRNAEPVNTQAVTPPHENPLDIPHSVFATVTAENLFIGTHTATNAILNAELSKGMIALKQVAMQVEGESSVALKGTIEQTAKGLRYQGEMSTDGKNLRALLASFEPAAAQFPERTFGAFHSTGNLLISSEQLRYSEANLQLGELQLNGGMVMYFDTIPRVEAEIAFKDTNLDYFRNNWRQEQQANNTNDFIFRINSSVDFGWLRQLQTVVDLRLSFDQFTFLDRQGTTGAFRIYARQGEIGLFDIDMRYPDGAIKGQVKINVAQELPAFDIALSVPQFDSAYVAKDGASYGPSWVSPDKPEKRWSDELFDFSWMIGVGGKLDLAFGQLTHHGETYKNFALKGTLQSELGFERFGGTITGTGTLIGGKVPGLSASFTAYNIDAPQLIHSIANYDKLSGRFSVSGTVATSGIHLLSWMQQADVKMVIAGRGVRPQNFNLQGVVDGVQAARSVADVITNVNRALPSGTTEFSVDGNVNIAGGFMRTPGLALKAAIAPNTPAIAGNFGGEISLTDMKLALTEVYQFPMLRSETQPTLRVELTGALENPALKIDTASLEAYVAKRIVGR
jgi:uncharacterized protein involved in outer membrane biogenesis